VTMDDELAYGLRPGVSVYGKNERIGLILSYPLKAIRLKNHWGPVLDLLERFDFVPFERILWAVNGDRPHRVELFLNDLVRKGFLRMKGLGPVAEYPGVTVVVPVRNRPEDLRGCLESLERVEYADGLLEIIVVDDASTDDTRAQVSAFPARLLAMGEQRGASCCRNLGTREAKGDIIAFLDSDCTVGRNWLRELVPAFNDPGVAGVGGWVDSYYQEKKLDLYEKVKSSLFMGSWPTASSEENRFFYVPSCNFLVRREIFLRVGGFNESLTVGEDVDLCWRLQNEGHKIEYRPVGLVFHKHRNQLKTFCFRRFDYGTSEPLLQKIHSERKKRMPLPVGATLFWGLILISLMIQHTFPAGLAAFTLGWEGFRRYVKAHGRDVPVGTMTVLIATGRSYTAFLYHLFAFASRYYLLPSIVVLLWSPPIGAVIWGMHLVTGLMEYVNKRPRIDPASFLWFFTQEQLFYQSGVWWACLKTLNFNPINPRLTTATK